MKFLWTVAYIPDWFHHKSQQMLHDRIRLHLTREKASKSNCSPNKRFWVGILKPLYLCTQPQMPIFKRRISLQHSQHSALVDGNLNSNYFHIKPQFYWVIVSVYQITGRHCLLLTLPIKIVVLEHPMRDGYCFASAKTSLVQTLCSHSKIIPQ